MARLPMTGAVDRFPDMIKFRKHRSRKYHQHTEQYGNDEHRTVKTKAQHTCKADQRPCNQTDSCKYHDFLKRQ